MLTLVGMLLLVLILMNQARRPDAWTWLWRMTGTSTTPPEYRSEPTVDGQGLLSIPLTASSPTASSLLNLPDDLLGGVRDDSHFRLAEQTAWFSLWQVLRESTARELESISLGDVSYLQIYRQTEAYRGRVVNLSGTIRRAHKVKAPNNDAGIEGYWQCWLLPKAGPREPIVVYALDTPTGLVEGMDLAEPARLTGIVYKRWSYPAQEALRVAPVVLAKNITLLKSATSTPDKIRTAPNVRPVVAVIATAAAALLVVAGLFRLSAVRTRHIARTETIPATIDLSELQIPSAPGDNPPIDDHQRDPSKHHSQSDNTSL